MVDVVAIAWQRFLIDNRGTSGFDRSIQKRQHLCFFIHCRLLLIFGRHLLEIELIKDGDQ